MSSDKKRHVIYIPGIGNSRWGYKFFSWWVKHENLEFHLVKMDWADGGDFESKLSRLISVIDELARDGRPISLIGISGGGIMALNAFAMRPNNVSSVVTICSPLTLGDGSHPTLQRTDKGIPVAREAILRLGTTGVSFTPQQRKRVMTFRPIYDEVAPTESMLLEGATNKKFFGFGHLVSLAIPQIFYAGDIASFIDSA